MFAVWLIRGCIVALAVVASVTDVRRRRVPDWLTLPPIALGLAVCAWRLHWAGVALWAAGVGGMAVLLAVPWLLGGLGGGDFKMALALGALGGPLFALQALSWSVAAGLLLFAAWGAAAAARAWSGAAAPGGMGGAAAAAGEAPLGTRLRLAAASGWRAVHEAPPPFAVAIGAGAVAALAVVVVR